MEDVVMVGYPNGLWDDFNNLPLFRRGITAAHPAIDFGGRALGVIDAACFPGSSGSPVLLFNRGLWQDKRGTTHGGNMRVKLLGVLAQGPQLLAEGQIVVRELPVAHQLNSVTPMMINLGYYIKAREITALVQHIMARFPPPPSAARPLVEPTEEA